MYRTVQLFLATATLLLASFAVADGPLSKVPLNPTTTISFATAEEGAALLGAADSWALELSPFDRSAHSQQLEDPGLDARIDHAAQVLRDVQRREVEPQTAWIDV